MSRSSKNRSSPGAGLGRFLIRVVGTALSLALFVVLLPYVSRLAVRLLPQQEDYAQQQAIILSEKLSASARMETSKADVSGVLSSTVVAKWIGTVRNNSYTYSYHASIGVDLSKATARASGNTVIVTLPEPEVLMDSIEVTSEVTDDFWSRMSTKDRDAMLAEEKLRLRTEQLEKYSLSGELWDNTVKALEGTFSSWTGLLRGSVSIQYEQAAPAESGEPGET